jgi:hypothetical protein
MPQPHILFKQKKKKKKKKKNMLGWLATSRPAVWGWPNHPQAKQGGRPPQHFYFLFFGFKKSM